MQRKLDTNQASLADELDRELAGTPAARAEGSPLFTATVAGKSGADLIVELGPRVQGAVPLDEFPEAPAVGSELKVTVRGQEDGLWLFSVREAKALADWANMELGSLVKGTVIGLNKGGLELKIGSVRAFLPASQVALRHVEDLASYADQTLVCEVIELEREKKRVVVSRRAVLESELRRKREEQIGTITEGAVCRGKVTRLESFGAFVDIGGGIEGLLHVSNMAHRRIEHPEELVKVGEEIEVQILKIEEGGRRIGLGRKQLEADPWDSAHERFSPEAVVNGRVVRIAPFGAFVELEPGLEGLLHISQLGSRVRTPNEAVKVGEELSVRVLSIDSGARRLSLSRLDPRGALIGSEESAEGAEIQAVLGEERPIGTNLGSLFKQALKKDE